MSIFQLEEKVWNIILLTKNIFSAQGTSPDAQDENGAFLHKIPVTLIGKPIKLIQ